MFCCWWQHSKRNHISYDNTDRSNKCMMMTSSIVLREVNEELTKDLWKLGRIGLSKYNTNKCKTGKESQLESSVIWRNIPRDKTLEELNFSISIHGIISSYACICCTLLPKCYYVGLHKQNNGLCIL